LIYAYRRHLVAIPGDQLPSEVRDSFGQLMGSLHAVLPLRGEDAVAASVRKMSNQEAGDCAAGIVEIFGITCRVLLSAARASAAVVQLHADREDGGDPESGEFEMPALIASR
jgi:hypothetical protein